MAAKEKSLFQHITIISKASGVGAILSDCDNFNREIKNVTPSSIKRINELLDNGTGRAYVRFGYRGKMFVSIWRHG